VAGLHYCAVVVGKRDLRLVGLEEVLVDVETWPEVFKRRLKPFHRIFLFAIVEALVVDAPDAQHHAQIAALG